MKKFITETWTGAKITEIEVERETENSVWIKGRRLAKKSTYDVYHETWEDAHDYLLSRAESKVRSISENLGIANSRLAKIKEMKRPD